MIPMTSSHYQTIRISVIIPVYNVARYVREAAESALAQPETAEVILIEDGSPDDSLAICEQLAHEYDQVRLLRHPNGENRGAGASRNVGILNAMYDLIAFLDADDTYLPGRFTVAAHILADQPEVDGVYEAVAFEYTSDAAREAWQRLLPEAYERGLLGPSEALPPDELLDGLLAQRVSCFSGDGLVVRRSALLRVGLYSLALSEDLVMCYKLASTARMVPGRLDTPVAMYRIFGDNQTIVTQTTSGKVLDRHLNMWETLWLWGLTHLTPEHEQRVFAHFTFWLAKTYRTRATAKFSRLSRILFSHPVSTIKRSYFVKFYLLSIPHIGFWLRKLAEVRKGLISPTSKG
jgi:glycosyltransferase involved in cell wall biosynthesis